MNLTKNDMARVIVAAFYNMKSLPAQDHHEVKRWETRKTKAELADYLQGPQAWRLSALLQHCEHERDLRGLRHSKKERFNELTLVTPDDWRDELHPRRARPIQKDGTTIGYLHEESCRGRGYPIPEHVTAVGDDPEILKILEKWHAGYLAEKRSEKMVSRAMYELEVDQRFERERDEARKALKL